MRSGHVLLQRDLGGDVARGAVPARAAAPRGGAGSDAAAKDVSAGGVRPVRVRGGGAEGDDVPGVRGGPAGVGDPDARAGDAPAGAPGVGALRMDGGVRADGDGGGEHRDDGDVLKDDRRRRRGDDDDDDGDGHVHLRSDAGDAADRQHHDRGRNRPRRIDQRLACADERRAGGGADVLRHVRDEMDVVDGPDGTDRGLIEVGHAGRNDDQRLDCVDPAVGGALAER